MHETSVPHWSWSMPRTARKRRNPAPPAGARSASRTLGGWMRPATPAKCAPTVFIGAPVTRKGTLGSR